MRTVLTIAGSDPGGGAGIQADLKTFAAHGVYGLTALTAVTVQNSVAVLRVHPMPPDLVVAQIDAVIHDFGADAVKIGMLATGGIAMAVADALRRHALTCIVLDPVLAATSGAALLEADGVNCLREQLLPLADVVTANLHEAEVLTGLRVRDPAEARQAARRLIGLGARAAIVKGGHLPGPPIDILDDGRDVIELHGERLVTRHTHGTGCTFAAAVAAHLALGHTLADAARDAKAYVASAIAHAPGLGHGQGPVRHAAGNPSERERIR
jgi:hydroxymethylpyrimidine/phosphomethylpyrimidine kinase